MTYPFKFTALVSVLILWGTSSFLVACAHSSAVADGSGAGKNASDAGKSGASTTSSLPPNSWTSINGKSCYVPPDFASITDLSERRFARSKAFGEASKRWQGEKDPEFSIKSYVYSQLEDGLMTQPERIETVLAKDLEKCLAWAEGKLTTDEYQAFFQSVVDQMAQSDCSHPDFDLVTQYLEVTKRWQVETLLCKNEAVLIRASEGQFTVEGKENDADTVWIGVSGDAQQPATDPSLPCHTQGCFKGQLVGRFVDRTGNETVFPVGKEKLYVAPAHGRISFAINDVELFDNRFRVKNQVTDYLTVEIYPAKRVE